MSIIKEAEDVWVKLINHEKLGETPTKVRLKSFYIVSSVLVSMATVTSSTT